MPVPFSGNMLNTSPVRPSFAGELSTLNLSEPTTGQVASAFISDIYHGNGSAYQDIQRMEVNQALDTENPISQDEWKAGDDYREGVSYQNGMTDKAAAILAQSEDDRKAREYVMGKASGLQTIAGFGVALGASIFEPKNLASAVAAGALTEGLGFAVPAFKRVLALGGEIGRYKALAIRGATEGALATAITEPSNRESAKIMQADYTMADSLLNFTMSTVLGGAIHAGAAKFKDVRAAKLVSDKPGTNVKEFDTALGQLTEGRKVDVEHVQEIEKAQTSLRAQDELPKIEEKDAEQLQVKKGQAQSDINLTADKEPITRAVNDAVKPDNSTAYNANDAQEINDFMGEYRHLEDDAALEKSLEFMQEDIQSMKEEGMLTGEQLAVFDELGHVDDDINLHDNILRSAYLCLTRG